MGEPFGPRAHPERCDEEWEMAGVAPDRVRWWHVGAVLLGIAALVSWLAWAIVRVWQWVWWSISLAF